MLQEKASLPATAWDRLTQTGVWRSIFRHPYPDTPRTRALVVVSNVFLHLHPAKVRANGLRVTYTLCLGGVAFFMFLVLIVTGALLMFYYVPSTTTAYQNTKDLESSVTFGMFLRNMHRYAAHLMVLMVFLHMARVFYTGAFKPPREFNWTVGVMLMALTFFLSFTGYLLPWDQLALWAITVGTNMAGATPLIGDWVRFLLIGGYEVGQNTLLRFYTLHVIVLPLVAAVLMAVHFWRVRKDGGISGPL